MRKVCTLAMLILTGAPLWAAGSGSQSAVVPINGTVLTWMSIKANNPWVSVGNVKPGDVVNVVASYFVLTNHRVTVTPSLTGLANLIQPPSGHGSGGTGPYAEVTTTGLGGPWNPTSTLAPNTSESGQAVWARMLAGVPWSTPGGSAISGAIVVTIAPY